MQQNCWDRLYTGIRAGIRLYWLESVSGTFMASGLMPMVQKYGKQFAVMSWSSTNGLSLDWPRIDEKDLKSGRGSLKPEAMPGAVDTVRKKAGASFIAVYKALQAEFSDAMDSRPPTNATPGEKRAWVDKINRRAKENEDEEAGETVKAVILVVHDADELFNASSGRQLQRFILESLETKSPIKLILTAPCKCSMDSYRDHCMELVDPLPTQEQIASSIAPVLQNVHRKLGSKVSIVFRKESGELVAEPGGNKVKSFNTVAAEIAGRLTGLTRPKARAVACIEIGESASRFASSKADTDKLEISATDLTREKAKILNAYGFMELINENVNEEDIGGLDRLKAWLHLRRNGFNEKAEQLCLDTPKGIVLVGPPGTAKSMCAKMAGKILGFPVIRLDMGAMFKSMLGESEANMARALRTADAASPCILWLDEILG